MRRYSRREFVGLAGMAGASLQQRLAFGQGAGRRPPNIIFIMADDLGYGDLGCYGQTKIRTPHIDALAAEGVRFTDAYSGCTVCAPSRSVLMTGLHMGHTSVRSNSGGVPLLAEDVTVGEVLKPARYATGCFGKWGLGDIGTAGVPWKQGFDEFFGYLYQVHAHFYYPEFLYDNGREYPLAGNKEGKRTTYSHDVIANRARGPSAVRTNERWRPHVGVCRLGGARSEGWLFDHALFRPPLQSRDPYDGASRGFAPPGAELD